MGVKTQTADLVPLTFSFVKSPLQDPEALAQLMSSMPLSNDGKFMLLNEESEDNTTRGDGQEESEA